MTKTADGYLLHCQLFPLPEAHIPAFPHAVPHSASSQMHIIQAVRICRSKADCLLCHASRERGSNKYWYNLSFHVHFYPSALRCVSFHDEYIRNNRFLCFAFFRENPPAGYKSDDNICRNREISAKQCCQRISDDTDNVSGT